VQSDYLPWLAGALYAGYVAKEFVYDWKTCADKALHLPASWIAFYIANVAILVLGIYCMSVGWKVPNLSQVYLALILTNVVFFHAIPTIIRRRFSSRLIRPNPDEVRLFGISLRIDRLVLLRRIAKLVLFLPAAARIYSSASGGGVLIFPALVISMTSVIVIVAYPILLLGAFGHRSKEVHHENPGN